MSDISVGPFDLPGNPIRHWLALLANPSGSPNSDDARPLMNGPDSTRRTRDTWTMVCCVFMPDLDAALRDILIVCEP